MQEAASYATGRTIRENRYAGVGSDVRSLERLSLGETDMYRDNRKFCYNCDGHNIATEPTPFDDEDGRRIVVVYRCRDCQALYVPGFCQDNASGYCVAI